MCIVVYMCIVEGPLYEITEQELEKALKGMKNDRAAGPSGLTSDMLNMRGVLVCWNFRGCFRKF